MIAAIGELLVEFVCRTTGTGHLAVADYTGPFASGAPAIFIDQAARMGAPTCFAGAVGADAFGQVVRGRLLAAGVDCRLIREEPSLPTGTAHVAYHPGGSRDFVFNIAGSAAMALPDPATIIAGFRDLGVTVLHVSGSSLGEPRMRQTIAQVAQALTADGGRLSVDPNIRPELIRDPAVLDTLRALIARAAYVLPSDADADLLWPGMSFADWFAALLRGGARVVALKRGAAGCLATDGGAVLAHAGHPVTVVDPTGAGDCFCGTLVALMEGGMGLGPALSRANLAAALSVTALGPMEGNRGMAEVEAAAQAVGFSHPTLPAPDR